MRILFVDLKAQWRMKRFQSEPLKIVAKLLNARLVADWGMRIRTAGAGDRSDLRRAVHERGRAALPSSNTVRDRHRKWARPVKFHRNGEFPRSLPCASGRERLRRTLCFLQHSSLYADEEAFRSCRAILPSFDIRRRRLRPANPSWFFRGERSRRARESECSFLSRPRHRQGATACAGSDDDHVIVAIRGHMFSPFSSKISFLGVQCIGSERCNALSCCDGAWRNTPPARNGLAGTVRRRPALRGAAP